MKTLVIWPGPEPMWQGGDALCRSRFPDIDFSFVTGFGPETTAAAADVESIITFGLSPAAASGASRLRWVQAMGSGLDRLTGLPELAGDVIVTGVHGLHGPPVSEGALGLMFAMSRHLPQLVRNQQQKVWAPLVSRLLHGATVGIVGVGAIAETLARKCKGLDMTVVGVTGAPRDLPHFDRMAPRSDLVAVAGEFDYLVLLAALTPDTRHVVNAPVLAAMKPSAFLINVGRGGLVDEPALITALQEGQIAGAGLDVFAQEPLAPESPLWDMPNVIVSPHNAGRREGYLSAVLDVFEENLAAYRAGRTDAMPTRVQRA